MSTSGTTAWPLTASDICKAAAEEIGAIAAGESLTTEEEERCILRLNGMLKSKAIHGHLFLEATGTVTVTGGVGSGTLPAEVRDISQVRFVNADGTERPLAMWNRGQFYQLPNRTTAGNPTACYYSQGVSVDTLHIWPVPAEDSELKVDYSRAIETVTDGAETLDLPEDWQEWVIMGLAARITNLFNVNSLDPATVQKVVAQAEEVEKKLFDHSRPDSYVFENSWV